MTQQTMTIDQCGAMPPALVVHPHALVGDGAIRTTAEFLAGETLGKYVERNDIDIPNQALVVWHNGHRVVDNLWRYLIPKTGDQIIIRTRVLGGGGGGKVLRTVAMLALIVVTYGVGTWGGLGASLADATGLALGTAQGLIMAGGTLMIAPLFPPVQPRVSK